MNGMIRPEAETMINPDTDQSSHFDAMYVYNDCNDPVQNDCHNGVNRCHNEIDSRFGSCDVIYSRDFDTVNNNRRQSSLAPNTTVLPEYDSTMLPGSDATVQSESDVTVLSGSDVTVPSGSDVTVVSKSEYTVLLEFDVTVLSGTKLDNIGNKQNSFDSDDIILNEVSQTGFKENCIKYGTKFKSRGEIEDMGKNKENGKFSVLRNNDDSSVYAKMTSTCCYTQSYQPQDYVTCAEAMNC